MAYPLSNWDMENTMAENTRSVDIITQLGTSYTMGSERRTHGVEKKLKVMLLIRS